MRQCLILFCLFVLFAAGAVFEPQPARAAQAKRMALPEPDKSGGMPLMRALSERKTTRSFSDKPVSTRDLSNLLWAAWGVNRPDGKHTAPSWRNNQEVLVFVVLQNGVWEYEPDRHELKQVLALDARDRFGGAPLHLLYAAPHEKVYAGFHVGSLYQNAGLYCASAGLANVVKGSGLDGLKDALPLPAGFKVMIVHSIGWPR